MVSFAPLHGLGGGSQSPSPLEKVASQSVSHPGGETLRGGLDPVPGAMGFPNGLVGRESACSEGDPSSIPGWEKIPWRRKWQPSPIFLPGKSLGERSLVGYSPWGCKSWTQLSNKTYQLPKKVRNRMS